MKRQIGQKKRFAIRYSRTDSLMVIKPMIMPVIRRVERSRFSIAAGQRLPLIPVLVRSMGINGTAMISTVVILLVSPRSLII